MANPSESSITTSAASWLGASLGSELASLVLLPVGFLLSIAFHSPWVFYLTLLGWGLLAGTGGYWIRRHEYRFDPSQRIVELRTKWFFRSTRVLRLKFDQIETFQINQTDHGLRLVMQMDSGGRRVLQAGRRSRLEQLSHNLARLIFESPDSDPSTAPAKAGLPTMHSSGDGEARVAPMPTSSTVEIAIVEPIAAVSTAVVAARSVLTPMPTATAGQAVSFLETESALESTAAEPETKLFDTRSAGTTAADTALLSMPSVHATSHDVTPIAESPLAAAMAVTTVVSAAREAAVGSFPFISQVIAMPDEAAPQADELMNSSSAPQDPTDTPQASTDATTVDALHSKETLPAIAVELQSNTEIAETAADDSATHEHQSADAELADVESSNAESTDAESAAPVAADTTEAVSEEPVLTEPVVSIAAGIITPTDVTEPPPGDAIAAEPSEPSAPRVLKIGIIGGSGLAKLLDGQSGRRHEIDTPFGRPSDAIIETEWAGVPVFLLARHGPGHLLNPTQVPYRANIFALKQLGCTHVIATGAVGSLREENKPRDLSIPDQIIDKTTRRQNTFYDTTAVHVEFSEPFCGELRQLLIDAGADLKATDHSVHDRGCYVAMEGPAFSTRAESLMHRLWGGDLIGMTAMPEAKLAREAELSYALLALVTDYDCWRQKPPATPGQSEAKPADKPDPFALLQEIIGNLDAASNNAMTLIRRAIELIPARQEQLMAAPSLDALRLAIWSDRKQIPGDDVARLRTLWGRHFTTRPEPSPQSPKQSEPITV